MSEENEPTSRKIMKMELENTGSIEDENIKGYINELKLIQTKILNLNEKACNEKQSILTMYNELKRPLFQVRNIYIKNIPNFWAIVLGNHTVISSLISENMEGCLRYLTNIEVEEGESTMTNFKINFFFKENPLIENALLTKEFSYKGNTVCTIRSTQIIWKEKLPSQRKKTKTLGQKRKFEGINYFEWFEDSICCEIMAEIIISEIWQNPIPYFEIGFMARRTEEVNSNNDDSGYYSDDVSYDGYNNKNDDILRGHLKNDADSHGSGDGRKRF
uniref:Nucleosome assembly protein n=1 Tax=Cuerna arida TaxID=1464854 RepID=A0A1B6GPU8_9HEMI